MGDDSPAALTRLLCGRDNAAREAALPRYLQYRGIAFSRHRFTRPEGRGDTYTVELGEGPRVLILCAHHDAVPGSPGANDNAAAVGILLHLIPRLPPRIPRGWRVRLLFTAAEELDYLGARAYVEDTPLDGVAGVLSLELCGIGDTVVLWDAAEPAPFLGTVTAGLESTGLRRDEGYRVVGRIPIFGSDHRAFAAAGLPAYGFTMVPAAHAGALRRFVLSPLRSTMRGLLRRPPPFDTYHTSGDALETLEPAALHRAAAALTSVVAGLG
ncbi:MAG: M28 family peptidase [Candidatus Rokuibacteriota bacterium]